MPDPDVDRFLQGLNSTDPGLRLRLAMHDGRTAISQIKRLYQLGGGRGIVSAIASWRNSYIKACLKASRAIDELFDAHAWPEDGARARDYEWKPREDYQRWLAAHRDRDLKRPE